MKSIIMIIRLTYLASSVLSLASASKAGKGVPEPPPPDASKASKSSPAPTYSSMSYSMSTPSPSDSKSGKGTTPIGSKSSKSKTDEYFIAPFSCPQKCISAEPYAPSSHLLEGAVNDCDASDSYQRWKVHQVGSLLKFESAAQHDHDMCLAVVHQDPVHVTNNLGYIAPEFWNISGESYASQDWSITEFEQFLSASMTFPVLGSVSEQQLVSEEDVDGICNGGKLGLAHCSHPGTNWYITGGKLLSAFCWNHDTSTAMSVDDPNAPTCTNLVAVDTGISGDLTTSETFMILKSN